MFNDIGPLELATIVVLAVLVFGPDKLPKVIQDITRTIRKIREFSESAKDDIRTELGPEFKDFEFEDLNPKTFIRKHLDGEDLGLGDIRNGFDLRKEMAEVTDAVNGHEISASPSSGASSSSASSSSSSSSSASSASSADGRVDLTKPAEGPGPDDRPPFDADAT
ncbi:sec-independent translocase [Streptomyces sp. YIM S03343]